jgi:hypothetical protein
MAKDSLNRKDGSTIMRSDDRIRATGEVFTPNDIADIVVDAMDEVIINNPKARFLERSAGEGNFVCALVRRIHKVTGRSYRDILENNIYCVELMRDNYVSMCDRILREFEVDIRNHPHYVNADALTYDYSFGEKIGLEAFFS